MKTISIMILLCIYFWFNFANASAQNTLAQFTNNLQNCTPGTFNVPLPISNASLIYSISSGADANTCQLTITQSFAGQNRVLNCLIAKQDLSAISQSLNDMAVGKTISPENLTSNLKGSSCQEVQP